jgi:hypothetical protein
MAAQDLMTMQTQQAMLYPYRHQTMETSTTPVTSDQIATRFIYITAIGDDHLVDFGEAPGATMTSAIVPKGATLLFNTEQFTLTDGDFVVSVRAVSGTGMVTIYHGI